MCIWLASGYWVVKLLSSVDNLVLRVKELGQLSNLQFLHGDLADFFLSRLARALEQNVRQFEGVNTTAFVSNQHNRVLLVERHMECGQLVSNGVEAAQLTVLLLVKIINLELTFVSDGSKHGGGVGSPLDITDGAAHIEADDRSLHVDKPHLDSPISRGRPWDRRCSTLRRKRPGNDLRRSRDTDQSMPWSTSGSFLPQFRPGTNGPGKG